MPHGRENQKTRPPDKIPIDMTPMIDIVFQLLTFFCMTLKVSAAEGDFNIKMPLAAPKAGLPDPEPASADESADAGRCQRQSDRLSLNDRSFNGAGPLQAAPQSHRRRSSARAASPPRPRSSSTATSVSNTSTSSKPSPPSPAPSAPDGQVIKLVEKIKFAPPRQE